MDREKMGCEKFEAVTQQDMEAYSLKPLQEAIFEFIRTTDKPTGQKAADNFGISLRTARRIISYLKAGHLVIRTGNNRTGSYATKNNNMEE